MFIKCFFAFLSSVYHSPQLQSNSCHARFTLYWRNLAHPYLSGVVIWRHIEAVLLVFVGSMSHNYQHQDHVVCDRVVHLHTAVPHLDESCSVWIWQNHVLQAERRLMNAAAHFCDHSQQTLLIGDSYRDLQMSLQITLQWWTKSSSLVLCITQTYHYATACV